MLHLLSQRRQTAEWRFFQNQSKINQIKSRDEVNRQIWKRESSLSQDTKIIQGDKKSTQQVNYGKTTHFISKYSCWSPQGIRGDLDFSYAYHFFTSTCAQWANFFFQGRKFEIDLRVKQKQIEFLFSSKSTWINHKKLWGPKNFFENFIK